MFASRMLRLRVTATAVASLVAPLTPAAVSAAANPHNLGSCSACHLGTPRFGVDARRDVAFTTSADDPGLCAPCHPPARHPHPVLVAAGSGPAGARVSAYLAPGTAAAFEGRIVCTSCHFVHASDTGASLLRGFPGSPDPRLFDSAAAFCEECHGGNLASRPAHAGGERSCAFCHAGEAKAGMPEGRAARLRERCELCHRGAGAKHFEKITPFGERRECLLCHDQHTVAGVAPGLLSAAYLAASADSVTIRPHYRRSLCFACHANTDDYALRDEDVNALCDRCHASGAIPPNIHPLRKVPASITVPKGWPLAAGALTCLTCHEQGHEDQAPARHMLRGGPYASGRAVCASCHSMTDLGASRIHEEINEGKSCELCHKTRPTPGVDTHETVTFIADPDLLCLRCHDQSAGDGSVHHTGVMGRELESGHIPVGLPLYRGRVACATCHNPHIREATGSRLREYLATADFCVGCHTN